MINLNYRRLIIALNFLSAMVANAATVTLNGKDCDADAKYQTISSTRKITIRNNRYSSTDLYNRNGTIKAHSSKNIDLTGQPNQGKIQIIFVTLSDNSVNNKLTTELWLTKNKICQVSDNQRRCTAIKTVDGTISKQSNLTVSLCPATSKPPRLDGN